MALVPEPPWPERLSPLKAVDDLLRCGICFDYFSIAMIIPQCSHNYCSLCIRKFLSYKTQCPTCCVAVSESDLKNNRTLDELVKSFNSARQQLFQLVLDTPPISSPLAHSRHSAGKKHVSSPVSWPGLKEEMPVIDSFLRKEKVCTSTKADGLAGTDRKIFKTEEHDNLYSSSADVDGKDNEVGSRESPESTKSHEEPSTSEVKVAKKVDCPVCEVAIPEQYINQHLDSCLIREEKKDSLRSSAHKRKPMSKVVYNLLSDRELKKKLKEHGLSTNGTRQQLIKRHQEFVHMYNAQCDSLNPKSVAEVVKQLEKNEKIRIQFEFNKTGEKSLTFTKDQTEQEIDEIHTDYQHREENHTAVVLGKAQKIKPETPDGKRNESSSLEESQRSVSPVFSLSSGSTSSSSSDILRDPQGPEMCSAASANSSFLGLRVNKSKSRQLQMPGNDQLLPKSKRKKR
ncbi:E3 ubiquitin-protein ligase RAD18 isoform X4 [Falco biarmicus]|uniref:E3 ubiquitin-protein ligase RAD18 isoform X4 n=1 Tax=Falco rusticolus TaxID=120794 RepID=UPI001886753F|nr:E3 ubiquitin-protein ligase RAD18 isoform X4 [Falco rusticolus]XP_055564258.1 E3 ubiquitin-protein ligase RAD18 isoform X4 [Falco cherrug]XP_056191832.1 E3 ubiquitin-protein ligase RAD18 isoform X4 [Falco biarmicus]